MTLYGLLWVILYSSISDEHIMIYLVTGTLESSNSIILNIKDKNSLYIPRNLNQNAVPLKNDHHQSSKLDSILLNQNKINRGQWIIDYLETRYDNRCVLV